MKLPRRYQYEDIEAKPVPFVFIWDIENPLVRYKYGEDFEWYYHEGHLFIYFRNLDYPVGPFSRDLEGCWMAGHRFCINMPVQFSLN